MSLDMTELADHVSSERPNSRNSSEADSLPASPLSLRHVVRDIVMAHMAMAVSLSSATACAGTMTSRNPEFVEIKKSVGVDSVYHLLDFVLGMATVVLKYLTVRGSD